LLGDDSDLYLDESVNHQLDNAYVTLF